MTLGWPTALWLVRHGESVGNVAADVARDSGAEVIDVALRDADVGLSPLGEEQATTLGRWLATVAEAQQPTVAFCSPYVRAQQTARLAFVAAGGPLASLVPVTDERLRDRDFGVLDRLTRQGITARYPEQSELRERQGKFYHRPPGGESWADVALRLRSFLLSLRLEYADTRVIVVAHDVVVLLFRYLLEGLTEREILDIGAQYQVANCAVTAYQRSASGMALTDFNLVLDADA